MSGKPRILLVEDDDSISFITERYLVKEGYEVESVANAKDMLSRLDGGSFDLVLLDLSLPDEDGLVLIRRVRTRSRIPIIVVSARGERSDKRTGLELGADDYVTKPFDPRELMLRVRNLLLRSLPPQEEPHNRVRAGGVSIDLDARCVTRDDGSEVALTRGEFNLLAALAAGGGRALSREQLMDAGCSLDALRLNSVDVLIHRLRRKLEADPSKPRLIVTVPGAGYRLEIGA